MISCRIAERASWLVSAASLGVLLAGLVQLLFMLPGLLTAMAADDDGFVVPPDRAMRIVGHVGREADIAEILSTRERTGGAFRVFHALMGEGYTLLNTQRDVCRFPC